MFVSSSQMILMLLVQGPIRTTFERPSMGNAGQGWETESSSFCLDQDSCLHLLTRLQNCLELSSTCMQMWIFLKRGSICSIRLAKTSTTSKYNSLVPLNLSDIKSSGLHPRPAESQYVLLLCKAVFFSKLSSHPQLTVCLCLGTPGLKHKVYEVETVLVRLGSTSRKKTQSEK